MTRSMSGSSDSARRCVARRLAYRGKEDAALLAALLAARQESHDALTPAVSEIIAAVRAKGDKALFEYTAKWDRFTPKALRLSVSEINAKAAECPAAVRAALNLAASRIAEYSKKQLPDDVQYTDATGATLGWRWTAVDSAGLYVPGGLATYPSSVLMNAIPAKIAGVKRLIVCVPAPEGLLNAAVLAACQVAGVDEIYTIGGAQAVAAMAYGTESIAPVDVIVGPGNAYVAEAKRQVYGRVGIDMIAGPSEVLVVADQSVPAEWTAMDLLSQAEHDERAQSILITDDAAYADAVEAAVAKLLTTLPRANIAASSWQNYGVVITVGNLLHDAPELIDQIAPEHLQITAAGSDAIAAHVRHAGAIFLGRFTPEAIGDYIAGPSHVLPTCGTARFASGLSIYDFLKRTSIIGANDKAFRALAPDAITLAASEGLDAHRLSMQLRLDKNGGT